MFDKLRIGTYNVSIMTSITTNLTTSGNSKAVRLPKGLLQMSGLGERVELEAGRGQIIIRAAKNPRAGWPNQIKKLLTEVDDPSAEFADMKTADTDLDSLPWAGPSFEDWHKTNADKH